MAKQKLVTRTFEVEMQHSQFQPEGLNRRSHFPLLIQLERVTHTVPAAPQAWEQGETGCLTQARAH